MRSAGVAAALDHFHKVINSTPPTIIAALRTMRIVTRSTSRKKSAVQLGRSALAVRIAPSGKLWHHRVV